MRERERGGEAEKETKENTEIMGKILMQEWEFVDFCTCFATLCQHGCISLFSNTVFYLGSLPSFIALARCQGNHM